jgi:hypothetical protein
MKEIVKKRSINIVVDGNQVLVEVTEQNNTVTMEAGRKILWFPTIERSPS